MKVEYEHVSAVTAWIVSYWDEGDTEATVTAFSNKEAGYACYNVFLGDHDHVQIDEYPVYVTFFVDGVAYGEK